MPQSMHIEVTCGCIILAKQIIIERNMRQKSDDYFLSVIIIMHCLILETRNLKFLKRTINYGNCSHSLD